MFQFNSPPPLFCMSVLRVIKLNNVTKGEVEITVSWYVELP
jgi:hypothetical protein